MHKICRICLLICLKYAENMHKICWNYAETMLKICRIIFRICRICRKICFKIFEKYAIKYVKNMQNMHQNMQNMSNTWKNGICNEYALKYAKYEKYVNKNAICTPYFADGGHVHPTTTTREVWELCRAGHAGASLSCRETGLGISLRLASPQWSDQTVQPRPRGPLLEPHGSPL